MDMNDTDFIDLEDDDYGSQMFNDTQPIPPSFNHVIEEDEIDTPYVKTRVAEIKKHMAKRTGLIYKVKRYYYRV